MDQMSLIENYVTPQQQWIAADGEISAPLFRRVFQVAGLVERASLSICGLGYHEAWINGERVGDHVLDPAQTDYEERVFFVRHEVTEMIREGENALGVVLGNGWYNQDRVWSHQDAMYDPENPESGLPKFSTGLSYGAPRLMAELELVYADGRREVVRADSNWRFTSGPITDNNIYAGEVYDARLEVAGWAEPGFDDVHWQPAEAMAAPGGELEEQHLPPMRRIEERDPVGISKMDSGHVVVDFGQNLSGWARICIEAEAGTEVSFCFAETIFPDGSIDTASTGVFATEVEQIDRYTCRGGGTEVWEPRFTYHGFRYVEVAGWPGELKAEEITAVVVHTDLPEVGAFECSDDRLNQLHRMALWTHRSNIHGIPEDCPARERCGWLGDANVVAEYSLWNYDAKSFWEKFLGDIETSRAGNKGIPCNIAPGKRGAGADATPDWAATLIMLPWYVYLYSGDTSVLSNHWKGMQALMAHYMAQSVDGCLDGGYGDWFDPGGDACCSHTAPALTTTLWFHQCATVMARTAGLLGAVELQQTYSEWMERIRLGAIHRFYDPVRGTFGSQTADVMALQFDWMDATEQPRVFARLLEDIERRDQHFNVGIMGMRYLFEVLSRGGQGALAMTLLHQNTYPSFGDLIQQGATTLWEYWGEPEHDVREGTRSLSHPMMGGYDNWFYNTLAGIQIDPEQPGFKHFFLTPHPIPGLDWVRCHHDTPLGRIESAWRIEEGEFIWSITVPHGATATAKLPGSANPMLLEAGRHRLSTSIHDVSSSTGVSAVLG
jgi:alpha-L-rhamnosidase